MEFLILFGVSFSNGNLSLNTLPLRMQGSGSGPLSVKIIQRVTFARDSQEEKDTTGSESWLFSERFTMATWTRVELN